MSEKQVANTDMLTVGLSIQMIRNTIKLELQEKIFKASEYPYTFAPNEDGRYVTAELNLGMETLQSLLESIIKDFTPANDLFLKMDYRTHGKAIFIRAMRRVDYGFFYHNEEYFGESQN
jgi:hypothetical protein